MSRFVLDASIAMQWFLEDEFDELARSVLDRLSDQRAVVPPIWLLEITNVLRTAERWRRISPQKADAILNDLLALPIDLSEPGTDYARRLLALCRQFDLTAYDAAYLELAIRESAPLATRDDALRRAASVAQVSLFPR